MPTAKVVRLDEARSGILIDLNCTRRAYNVLSRFALVTILGARRASRL